MVQKAWQSNEFREVVATPVEDRRLARLSSQDLSETRNRRFRRPVEAKVESEESDESGEKNNGRRVHVVRETFFMSIFIRFLTYKRVDHV